MDFVWPFQNVAVPLWGNQTKTVMASIFNDLNKLVNTVQKVDKLLSEKPKRTRINLHNIKLTAEELRFLRHMVTYYGEECYNMDDVDNKLYTRITKKLQ